MVLSSSFKGKRIQLIQEAVYQNLRTKHYQNTLSRVQWFHSFQSGTAQQGFEWGGGGGGGRIKKNAWTKFGWGGTCLRIFI